MTSSVTKSTEDLGWIQLLVEGKVLPVNDPVCIRVHRIYQECIAQYEEGLKGLVGEWDDFLKIYDQVCKNFSIVKRSKDEQDLFGIYVSKGKASSNRIASMEAFMAHFPIDSAKQSEIERDLKQKSESTKLRGTWEKGLHWIEKEVLPDSEKTRKAHQVIEDTYLQLEKVLKHFSSLEIYRVVVDEYGECSIPKHTQSHLSNFNNVEEIYYEAIKRKLGIIAVEIAQICYSSTDPREAFARLDLAAYLKKKVEDCENHRKTKAFLTNLFVPKTTTTVSTVSTATSTITNPTVIAKTLQTPIPAVGVPKETLKASPVAQPSYFGASFSTFPTTTTHPTSSSNYQSKETQRVIEIEDDEEPKEIPTPEKRFSCFSWLCEGLCALFDGFKKAFLRCFGC